MESDGHILTMVRFVGDSDGNLPSGVEPKGPVLLMAGAYYDSLGFFLASTSTPERLFNAGYDVWIANRRGTKYSQGHTTTDLITDDPEEFWDWDVSEIGEEDVPALISEILETRFGEGSDCKKVSVLAYSTAANEASIALAAYPSTSADWVS